ncbi:MAG: ribonuclease III [Treponema sp.]|nr:ribonuclease III [Treponema sp.]
MNTTLTTERKNQLVSFCKTAGIKIQNLELLDLAFYHRSSSNENKKSHEKSNNERLEFLGDSVLGLVTASWLYTNLPDYKEGELAKIKSVVVSEKILAPNALRLGIDKLLVLGHGEEITGGRKKPAILADCMEAVIGAYYLDSGFEAAREYVLSFIVPEIKKVLENGTKDFKTLLQELTQKKFKVFPVYELLDTKGPEHEKIFTFNVRIGDKVFGPVSGSSKKDAEQKLAEQVYNELKKI